ncbi:unnamed protein product [Mytilus edulis]|uniref:Endonuclease/exonuclease/phosphatase domain-containing protein n=1 Tax=Mytilus edulis TaxID=6550 RepID=A0A8S3QIH5_MYTED|nr:unnamed protein product [Mytilus edulis]
MNPKKSDKPKRKRNKSNGQNTSGEKPNKRKSNSTHTDSNSVTKSVNKSKNLKSTDNPIKPVSNMSIQSTPVHESPMVEQNRNYQQFHNIQNPNFLQTSPTPSTLGFFPGTPHNTYMQPMMHSTMNPTFLDNGGKLDMLTQKVDMICEKISNIDKLTEKLNKFDKTVNSMVKSVESINKRVDEVEKGLNFINAEFENNKKDVREVKKHLTEIRSENEEATKTIDKLRTDFEDLNERQLDLQTRSMRENLIFTGIPMYDESEQSEETEKIIENFMTVELKMETLPKFHRAHRFGKKFTEKNPDGSIKFVTKPIVCRFVNFKQRELVRKAARELKDTKYGINEQFPKEINDRRKALWPHFQEARRQRKKAFFKRDRLFIEGNEFTPKDTTKEMDTNDRQTRSRHQYNEQGARPREFNQSKFSQPQTKLDDVDEIDCDNFIFHYKNRKKLANHKSGGIALGFKKYLDKYIKYIQSDCQFVLWFSIDKKVLDLPKDAIFGIIYIPPINTSYTSEDAFTEIEFELQNFCSKTNYITMLGDFNSRTGNLSDFYNIDKDSSFENNFTDYNELSDVDVLDELGIPRLRNSIDTVVNGYGRKFIDFCKNNRMFILNGRLEENKTGSPTSRNSSVIDYALSSTHFL